MTVEQALELIAVLKKENETNSVEERQFNNEWLSLIYKAWAKPLIKHTQTKTKRSSMKKAELPHDRNFPSPVEIKLKMAEGYGAAAGGALDSLFSHCALVAENIFYKSTGVKTPPKNKTTVSLNISRQKGHSKYKKYGYQCPKCAGDINATFHYCPFCGTGLNWVKTKKVAGLKIDEIKLLRSA